MPNIKRKNNSNNLKSVWIVIPAHNEEKNIGKVIDSCKKYSKNIIIVDDGSKDNTSIIAKDNGVIVLRHIVNLGKGATLKTGCDYVYNLIKRNSRDKNKTVKNKLGRLEYNVIVLIDADGQHDPNMIPKFLEKIKDKDIIFGTRKYNKDMPIVLKMGNNFINYIIWLLFHIKIQDSQCGYRAFRINIYKKIRWITQDYSMESEMIANVSKHKLRYSQIRIPTLYQDNYKGTTIIDGVRIIYNIFKWWVAK